MKDAFGFFDDFLQHIWYPIREEIKGRDMTAIIKDGRERPLLARHQWIFSGAIESLTLEKEGDIAKVLTKSGELIGHAYFNRKSDIIGRMISLGNGDPIEALQSKVKRALALRKSLFSEETTAFRLINGEGDGCPGFIADLYDDVLVIQVGTLGMENLKEVIVDAIKEEFPVRAVYEKSTAASRKKEGLAPKEGLLYGTLPEELIIKENGLSYFVNVREGQKTGFFLDHREMRERVRELARGRRVLNCFSYTGGFSVSALKGGAAEVVSVDSSKQALEIAEKNFALNGFASKVIKADAFQFLRDDPLDYDLVILDPPAFAKTKGEVAGALRGYREINRETLKKMPKNSLLLTASCSYYVDDALFEKAIYQAALEAKRDVAIIGRHIQAPDHPISLFHPESDYLKSLLLAVS